MLWIFNPNASLTDLGLLPAFLNEGDPRPAKEQLDWHYKHGGGWRPFKGFTLNCKGRNMHDWTISYPDDPDMTLVAYCKIREELVLVFDYSWVCILQPDGKYEIARMD